MPLRLRIITPTKIAFDGPVESLSATDLRGDFEVLPQHAGMLTTTRPGLISYKDGAGEHRLNVLGGFVEVSNDQVTVLIDGIREN